MREAVLERDNVADRLLHRGNIRLTPKQARFVASFLCHRNATRAAVEAGYSPRTARAMGAENLTKPAVATRIAAHEARLCEMDALQVERLKSELLRLCFSDIRKVFHPNGRIKAPHEIDEDTAAAIESYEVTEREKNGITRRRIRISFWDKNAAIDKVMKHYGLYERQNTQVASAVSTAFLEMRELVSGTCVAPLNAPSCRRSTNEMDTLVTANA